MKSNSCTSATICGGFSTGGKTLSQLVQEYIDFCRPAAVAELRFFASQSLADAIEFAAHCLDSSGKRSSHQWRRSKQTLVQAHEVLRFNSGRLQGCRTFSGLHDLIDQLTAHIRDIGPLYSYDAALHIGAKLGLTPDSVYLHCGTREGARALGLPYRQPTLDVGLLPTTLRRLAAPEIEDFLCIFKGELQTAMT